MTEAIVQFYPRVPYNLSLNLDFFLIFQLINVKTWLEDDITKFFNLLCVDA